MGKLQIGHHQQDTDNYKHDSLQVESYMFRTFNQDYRTYRQTDDTCNQRRNIFPDIDCMPDMDKEVTHQREEYSVP